MVVKKKCDEPGCVKGHIPLFTSNNKCPKCSGQGYLYETVDDYQSKSAMEQILEDTNRWTDPNRDPDIW